jgi:PAS domain S-box-containing protein
MNWALAGLVYCGTYAALVAALGDRTSARLLVGNAALLLPPIVPLAVILWRRDDWRGRQAVFFGTIAAWAALWLIGQIAWAFDEVVRSAPLPWFKWHIILQLSGSALPLIAIVAWPHRGTRSETALTAAIDIAVLVSLTGFLYWSLIIAPGMVPSHSALALRSLAFIGPSVRLVSVIGLVAAAAAAGNDPWRSVYSRLAAGLVLAFAVLIVLSFTTLRGNYQTGSPADVGWMLPFWFAAWAAATAPASVIEARSITASVPRHASPTLLFTAILIVTVVGYGLRYLMPLGQPVDRMRDLATACTLVTGIGLVMVRLRVDQRAVDRANDRVRLLATACEHAGDLIIIAQGKRIAYANDAFCRAVGYTLEELRSLAPEQLVAPESRADLPALRERLRAHPQILRATTWLARKDGTTFQSAWSAAPMLDASGRIASIVGVIRDVTDDVRLREQLVRGERLSAIGELVSGVAHELNNPLQSIIGTLDVLLKQAADPATRTDIERARFEAGRAGRIIRNLLTFARKSPEERLLVDLNEIAQAAVSVRAYELEMAAIQIDENYAAHLPLVLANREEIQQVVAHLIINAHHAMASAHGRGILRVRTYLLDGQAALEISDDGPGVAPDVAPRLFEPFVTTKPEVSGTGFGLSMSFGIATAHGGKLELVPSDAGACFRLLLPGAGFAGPVQA